MEEILVQKKSTLTPPFDICYSNSRIFVVNREVMEMDNGREKGNLIQELADAFVKDEGPTKENEGNRFNRSTGTLIASNTFINYALSHIDEGGFTKGKVYKCSQIQDDFTRIICDTGEEIRVNINDPDFSFKVNPRK